MSLIVSRFNGSTSKIHMSLLYVPQYVYSWPIFIKIKYKVFFKVFLLWKHIYIYIYILFKVNQSEDMGDLIRDWSSTDPKNYYYVHTQIYTHTHTNIYW